MRKIMLIARADLLQLFRDRTALIFMLALPFGLTLVTGFAFGDTTLRDIPVIIVNQDHGPVGAALSRMFASEGLRPLLNVETMTDADAARARLRADEAAAVILVPPLSDALPSDQPSTASITLITNPSRPVSSLIVRTILARFTDTLNLSFAAGSLVFQTLAEQNALPQEATALQTLGEAWGASAAQTFAQESAARITFVPLGETQRDFDPIAYFAPSMAIFTLMFTMTQGSNTLLEEREQWTLQRMLATPTRLSTILAGKLIGLWLGGGTQLAILLSASALLFGVSWGNPLAVGVVCFALIVAASSWGLLIAAFARTSSEARTLGVLISMIFGIAAGHFFPRTSLPPWLQQASRISPNAWGLDAFLTLLNGGTLSDILFHTTALFTMALILFGVAAVGARRQFSA